MSYGSGDHPAAPTRATMAAAPPVPAPPPMTPPAEPATALADEDLEEYDYVVKLAPDGSPVRVPVDFSKISARIRDLMQNLAYGRRLRRVNRVDVEKEVISRFKSGLTTREIDTLIVETCRTYSARHPDYGVLAARLQISNLQKQIDQPFREVYERLYATGVSRLSEGYMKLVREFGRDIEGRIDYHRDFNTDAFSVSTFYRTYVLKYPDGRPAELPQHTYMRVALAICCLRPSAPGEPPGGQPKEPAALRYHLEEAFDRYDRLSLKLLSHATPTMINAGTVVPQLASCFGSAVPDNFRGIQKANAEIAEMSKMGGGCSFTFDQLRAAGALIRSSGGEAQGVAGALRIFDANQEYSSQGGTRKGAWAAWLTPHHADVFDFLDCALTQGARYESRKSADHLKYGLWVPDRFFRALVAEIDAQARAARGAARPGDEAAGLWHLFSPDEAPGLDEVFDERSVHHPDGPGGAYSDLYDRYVAAGRFRRTTKASEVMRAVLRTMGITGGPYLMAKDNVCRQSNLVVPAQVSPAGDVTPGVMIRHSNLCTEITLPDDEATSFVCVLDTLPLPNYVRRDLTAPAGYRVDFTALIEGAGVALDSLDRIVDVNVAPVASCAAGLRRYRAVGLGVIGLADVFARLGLPFGSPEALRLDAAIHACIYYGALRQSIENGRQNGNFPAYPESKAARGLLQPDLCVLDGCLQAGWADAIAEATGGLLRPEMWEECRRDVRVDPATGAPGALSNGELTASPPTATSANVQGGMTEGTDPFTALVYLRKTMAGEFVVYNTPFAEKLEELGLMNDETSDLLLADQGSIASWDGTNGRPFIPEHVRRVFRTAREIPQCDILAHACSRGPWVTQAQSTNTFRVQIRGSEIVESTIAGWVGGAKTLSYYTHSLPAAGSQMTSIRRPAAGGGPPVPSAATVPEGSVCRRDDPSCEACSA